MTATTAVPRRSFYDAVVGDLVELVKAQPHQALISSASVAIVASEAAALVPAPFNVAMALGAEWAYLRGIASSGKGARGWVTALNWGALALVVLYGMLWGARKFGALPAEPTGIGAWLLTAAHILPVAFLSLAAAMVHRSAVEVEAREAEQRAEDARRREAALQAEDDERRRRREAAEDAAYARRLEAEAEVAAEKAKALARLEYRQRVASQAVTGDASQARHAASGRSAREVFKAAVIAAFRDDPQFNRADLARAHGWSRPAVNAMIDEARAAGEL